MFEQALHDMEAMLNLGAHASLRLLQLFDHAAQWIFLEYLRPAFFLPRRLHDCHISKFNDGLTI